LDNIINAETTDETLGYKMKPTPEKLLKLATELAEEDDNQGICVECGSTQSDCEPDASNYRCEECGSYSVYGAEQIMLTNGVIDVDRDMQEKTARAKHEFEAPR
jgi:hypothetical protein